LFFFFPICKKHKYPFLSLLFSSQLLHFSFMLRYVFFSFLLSFFFLINILYKFVFFSLLSSLQDFTVLSTDKFRRCVIRSSSVIFLPTEYVRRLSFRRWFPLPSLYRSEKQKNHLPMVLQTEFGR
jgi:hypothetical protein